MDHRQFRHTLGQFATGVVVIMTRGPEGPHGMTANSLTSVSLDPPQVLFCVNTAARTRTLVREVPRFTVSILSERQEALSRLFADPHPASDPLIGVPHSPGIDGIPILNEALAFLDCRVTAIHPAGDHDIVVGTVEDLGILHPGLPLLYFAGRYRRLNPANPD